MTISKSDLQIGDIIHFENQDGISGKSLIVGLPVWGVETETIEVHLVDEDDDGAIDEEDFEEWFGIDGKTPHIWNILVESITEIEAKAIPYDPNQIGDLEDDI